MNESLKYFTWPEIYFDLQNEIDIYRLALHQKKVSSLLGNLLKREVVFDEAEKALVESALSQMEKFKEDVTRSLSSQLSTIFLIISVLFQTFLGGNHKPTKIVVNFVHKLLPSPHIGISSLCHEIPTSS